MLRGYLYFAFEVQSICNHFHSLFDWDLILLIHWKNSEWIIGPCSYCVSYLYVLKLYLLLFSLVYHTISKIMILSLKIHKDVQNIGGWAQHCTHQKGLWVQFLHILSGPKQWDGPSPENRHRSWDLVDFLSWHLSYLFTLNPVRDTFGPCLLTKI